MRSNESAFPFTGQLEQTLINHSASPLPIHQTENAMITQSRFILLDAPMMLFMGYTMLAWINFYNHRNRPFTRGWWFWLIQTGFSLFLSSR
jgi:dolichyl-phosphate-mannose--protein O-mannosyl transferase